MAPQKQAATKFSLVGLVLAVLAAIFYPRSGDAPAAPDATPPSTSAKADAPPAVVPAPANTNTKAGSKTDAAPKPVAPPSAAPAPTKAPANAPAKATSKVGFTSTRSLQDHFEKHGAEFGDITIEEYLARACALRDAPLSSDVLEVRRDSDGVISRFDKKSGGFVAFHDDKTIRTFFRPNDGEAYFRRQAQR